MAMLLLFIALCMAVVQPPKRRVVSPAFVAPAPVKVCEEVVSRYTEEELLAGEANWRNLKKRVQFEELKHDLRVRQEQRKKDTLRRRREEYAKIEFERFLLFEGVQGASRRRLVS